MMWKLATEIEFISFDNLLTCLYINDAHGNKEEVWLIGFKTQVVPFFFLLTDLIYCVNDELYAYFLGRRIFASNKL